MMKGILIMKRSLIILGVLVQLVAGQAAYALTFSDTVNYWPTWGNGTSQDNRDVLGQPDITGGTATVTADHLLTQVSFAATTSWSGLMPTDLFINVVNSANDTTWDYVVKTMSWSGSLGGNFSLYNITSLGISSLKPSNFDAATSPYEFGYERIGQPVGLKDSVVAGLTPIGSVYFEGLLANSFATSYTFNDGLFVGNDFILGWGVTCGNDMILEQLPVPEPGTMALLGAGLLTLVIFGKRRMNKEA